MKNRFITKIYNKITNKNSNYFKNLNNSYYKCNKEKKNYFR